MDFGEPYSTHLCAFAASASLDLAEVELFFKLGAPQLRSKVCSPLHFFRLAFPAPITLHCVSVSSPQEIARFGVMGRLPSGDSVAVVKCADSLPPGAADYSFDPVTVVSLEFWTADVSAPALVVDHFRLFGSAAAARPCLPFLFAQLGPRGSDLEAASNSSSQVGLDVILSPHPTSSFYAFQHQTEVPHIEFRFPPHELAGVFLRFPEPMPSGFTEIPVRLTVEYQKALNSKWQCAIDDVNRSRPQTQYLPFRTRIRAAGLRYSVRDSKTLSLCEIDFALANAAGPAKCPGFDEPAFPIHEVFAPDSGFLAVPLELSRFSGIMRLERLQLEESGGSEFTAASPEFSVRPSCFFVRFVHPVATFVIESKGAVLVSAENVLENGWTVSGSAFYEGFTIVCPTRPAEFDFFGAVRPKMDIEIPVTDCFQWEIVPRYSGRNGLFHFLRSHGMDRTVKFDGSYRSYDEIPVVAEVTATSTSGRFVGATFCATHVFSSREGTIKVGDATVALNAGLNQMAMGINEFAIDVDDVEFFGVLTLVEYWPPFLIGLPLALPAAKTGPDVSRFLWRFGYARLSGNMATYLCQVRPLTLGKPLHGTRVGESEASEVAPGKWYRTLEYDRDSVRVFGEVRPSDDDTFRLIRMDRGLYQFACLDPRQGFISSMSEFVEFGSTDFVFTGMELSIFAIYAFKPPDDFVVDVVAPDGTRRTIWSVSGKAPTIISESVEARAVAIHLNKRCEFFDINCSYSAVPHFPYAIAQAEYEFPFRLLVEDGIVNSFCCFSADVAGYILVDRSGTVDLNDPRLASRIVESEVNVLTLLFCFSEVFVTDVVLVSRSDVPDVTCPGAKMIDRRTNGDVVRLIIQSDWRNEFGITFDDAVELDVVELFGRVRPRQGFPSPGKLDQADGRLVKMSPDRNGILSAIRQTCENFPIATPRRSDGEYLFDFYDVCVEPKFVISSAEDILEFVIRSGPTKESLDFACRYENSVLSHEARPGRFILVQTDHEVPIESLELFGRIQSGKSDEVPTKTDDFPYYLNPNNGLFNGQYPVKVSKRTGGAILDFGERFFNATVISLDVSEAISIGRSNDRIWWDWTAAVGPLIRLNTKKFCRYYQVAMTVPSMDFDLEVFGSFGEPNAPAAKLPDITFGREMEFRRSFPLTGLFQTLRRFFKTPENWILVNLGVPEASRLWAKAEPVLFQAESSIEFVLVQGTFELSGCEVVSGHRIVGTSSYEVSSDPTTIRIVFHRKQIVTGIDVYGVYRRLPSVHPTSVIGSTCFVVGNDSFDGIFKTLGIDPSFPKFEFGLFEIRLSHISIDCQTSVTIAGLTDDGWKELVRQSASGVFRVRVKKSITGFEITSGKVNRIEMFGTVRQTLNDGKYHFDPTRGLLSLVTPRMIRRTGVCERFSYAPFIGRWREDVVRVDGSITIDIDCRIEKFAVDIPDGASTTFSLEMQSLDGDWVLACQVSERIGLCIVDVNPIDATTVRLTGKQIVLSGIEFFGSLVARPVSPARNRIAEIKENLFIRARSAFYEERPGLLANGKMTLQSSHIVRLAGNLMMRLNRLFVDVRVLAGDFIVMGLHESSQVLLFSSARSHSGFVPLDIPVFFSAVALEGGNVSVARFEIFGHLCSVVAAANPKQIWDFDKDFEVAPSGFPFLGLVSSIAQSSGSLIENGLVEAFQGDIPCSVSSDGKTWLFSEKPISFFFPIHRLLLTYLAIVFRGGRAAATLSVNNSQRSINIAKLTGTFRGDELVFLKVKEEVIGMEIALDDATGLTVGRVDFFGILTRDDHPRPTAPVVPETTTEAVAEQVQRLVRANGTNVGDELMRALNELAFRNSRDESELFVSLMNVRRLLLGSQFPLSADQISSIRGMLRRRAHSDPDSGDSGYAEYSEGSESSLSTW
jgi:hypothetical protein